MALRSRTDRLLGAVQTDRTRSRRWLWSGTGVLVQYPLVDWGSSGILTNDPQDKEERDQFGGEQDDHSIKRETTVNGGTVNNSYLN